MVIALTQCLYRIANQEHPREKNVIGAFPAEEREKDTHSGLYKGVIYLHGVFQETLQLH